MHPETIIPSWLEKRRTSFPVFLLLGAILAASHCAASLTNPDVYGRWNAFLICGAGITLLALFLITGVLWRCVIGKLNAANIRLRWWTLGLFLAINSTFFATLWLIPIAIIAVALNWGTKGPLTSATIAVMFHFLFLTYALRISVKIELLIRHWSQRKVR